MSETMTPEKAALLREPFRPEQIGKLPRGGTTLDFVGHAAVTDRLLRADPLWTWEPMAYAADGGPLIRVTGKDAELWIWLTVCGHKRPGVGTAPAGSFELAKQLVSDAIRNGAMRFGVALNLWSKEELDAPEPPELITPGAAESFRGVLNNAGKAARADWLHLFGCQPADLPLSRLAEANEFIASLTPPTEENAS